MPTVLTATQAGLLGDDAPKLEISPMHLQDTVYLVKGAVQEELTMQGRGKEPQAWLDSFDTVTPCTVLEVRLKPSSQSMWTAAGRVSHGKMCHTAGRAHLC